MGLCLVGGDLYDCSTEGMGKLTWENVEGEDPVSPSRGVPSAWAGRTLQSQSGRRSRTIFIESALPNEYLHTFVACGSACSKVPVEAV